MTNSEKIKVLKSAGYSEATARRALNIGVLFFNSTAKVNEFDDSLTYDKGYLDGKEIFFVDTSICQ